MRMAPSGIYGHGSRKRLPPRTQAEPRSPQGDFQPPCALRLASARSNAARSPKRLAPPMDALTAAFALIIAQLCIALVMTGAHFAARPERCTQYWASSAILIVV